MLLILETLLTKQIIVLKSYIMKIKYLMLLTKLPITTAFSPVVNVSDLVKK